MKTSLQLFISFSLFGLLSSISTTSLSQTDSKSKILLPDAVYDEMKANGKLKPDVDYIIVPTIGNHPAVAPANDMLQDQNPSLETTFRSPNIGSSSCSCIVPLDATFTIAEFAGGVAPSYRNDDGSTASKVLPFNFCLYGTNYASVFINNNGNVSFGNAWGTFTSTGFPSNQYVMVAPFWADVDTRNVASGLVYYKITPTYMIVKWEAVGYYSQQVDKVNTFQLIITDGSDPILPNGNNVAFCYGDMQWTTGAASGGVNGFGGTHATVGINKGDGVNFAQVGRFGQAGASFTGSGNAVNNGVSWLDNQSFYFNSCGSTNIAPISAGLNNCDTIKVCGNNDTLIVNGLFLSPESGQTTSVSITWNGLPLPQPGVTVLANTAGNFTNPQVMVIASSSMAGSNILQFTATDNGTPAQTTIVNSILYIDTTGLAAFNPIVLGVTEMCQGNPTTLSVTPTNYTSYLWNNGNVTTTNTITVPGTVWVTSQLNNCYKTSIINVIATPAPNFSYIGTPFCQSPGATNPTPTYGLNAGAGIFTATPSGLVIDSLTGVVNLSASIPGVYTVTNSIAATLHCPAVSATSPITIGAFPDASFSYTGTPYCNNGANPLPTLGVGATAGVFSEPTNLFVDPTTGEVIISSPPGNYTVTNFIAPANGCPASIATAPITITDLPIGTFSYINSPYCMNAFTSVSPTYPIGSVGGIFTSTGSLVIDSLNGQVFIAPNSPGTYTVTSTIAASGGCPTVINSSILTLTAAPVATFSYPNQTYCQNSSNPTPTFIGTTGTISASPFGLNFTNTTGGINLAGSQVGTYTVTNFIPASNGCAAVSAATTITITAPQSAAFSYSGSPFCQNAGNQLPTISGAPGTFSANPSNLVVNPATGEIDLTTGVGTFTVTNSLPAGGGCPPVSATSVITITPASLADFTYNATQFCKNGTNPSPTFINGGVAGAFTSTPNTLNINSNTGVIDLTTSSTGTYIVTNSVPGVGNCPPSTVSVTITITALPISTFTYIGSPFCQNAVSPPPVFTGGGVAGVFTANPQGLIINSSTGLITLPSPPNTYVVTNTIPAAGGCPAVVSTSTVVITAAPLANFSYTGTPFCLGSSATPLPVFGSGSTAGTFTVIPSGLVVNPVTGQLTLSNSQVGNYTIINTIPASGGCAAVSASTGVVISAPATGNFSYTGNPYCVNSANPIPTLGAGSVTGTWTASPQGLPINQGNGQVNMLFASPGTYTVTNTLPVSAGCPSGTATNTLTIIPLQNAAYSYSAIDYCKFGTTSPTITGVPGGTFTSSPAGLIINATSGTVDLGASPTNTYLVTYNTPGPCPSSYTQSIIIHAAPTAVVAPAQIDCHNGQAILNGTGSSTGGNISYVWNTQNGSIIAGWNSLNPTVAGAGVYTLSVTNTSTNCTTTSSVTLTPNPAPTASFTADPTLGPSPLLVNFTNTSTNATSYQWSFGDGSPISSLTSPSHTYTGANSFYGATLYAYNSSNCIDSVTFTIWIYDDYFLAIPNVFTPNGDAKNDIFKVEGLGIQDFHGDVYDRWGLKLFTWNEVNGGWDGNTTSGQTAAEGTYYYIIKAKGFNNEEHEEKGSFMLLR